MSSNAPDFSSTFELVDDELAETEKRLEQRRKAKMTPPQPAGRPDEPSTDAKRNDAIEEEVSPPRKKPATKRPETSTLQLVKKEVRRNLTLKVLEENEVRFNELFHKLQLKGDSRKKQQLADEALLLLFTKYAKVL